MIDVSQWEGKTLAVMGLGKTGCSTCDVLLKAGIKVLAWDDREDTRAGFKHQDILTDLNDVDFESDIDALILSPGIPHTYPKPHPIAQKAINAVVPVYCDVELFARGAGKIPYVAITGTNGKSTTTALIGHILNYDRPTEVGGNLGKPVLDLKQRGVRSYVLELSSYQLERCPSIKPKVGVWLNITPDHLDRHGDLEGYIDAKRRMFANYTDGAVAVISVDDEHSKKVADDLDQHSDWQVERISVHDRVKNGYYIEDGRLWRVMETPPQAEQEAATDDKNEDGTTNNAAIDNEPFMCTDLRTYPKLKGIHNWQNAACAFAACEAMGMSAQDIENAMRDYAGLAHRQYVVDTINGVPYINDSKATNADAASMALRSFDNIYWILGGQPKEGGLEGLEKFASRVKHAFVIGTAQDEFADWLDKHDIPFSLCGTLDTATRAAHDLAQGERGLPGGGPVVLLSPACASFDQFDNFETRGDAFTKLVQDLAKDEAA